MVITEQGLFPERTLFVDDKQINLDAAAQLGLVTELCHRPQDLRGFLKNTIC